MSDRWRYQPSADEIADEVAEYIRHKWARGQEKYGERFVGDPLDQAIEDATDTVMYLWTERRKRQEEREHATYGDVCPACDSAL